MAHIAVHPKSALFLQYFDQNFPKNVNKTQVGSRTSLVISSLDPASHYVFTLVLEQCSAAIALSHALVTFGRERACSIADVLHSIVVYTPIVSGSSPVHGTKATVACDVGYSLENQYNETSATCLDNIWVPSLSVCRRVKLCSFPRKPNNGQFSITGLNEGSKAHNVCHKGYRLSGRRVRTCNGRFWDGRRPRCQPLHCPIPKYGENGAYVPCRHMKYTNTYGTYNKPLEGYCVKLRCNEEYLPSHEFYGPNYRPRWESEEVPQGGITCSDRKWIGFLNDTCDLTVKLTSVEDY